MLRVVSHVLEHVLVATDCRFLEEMTSVTEQMCKLKSEEVRTTTSSRTAQASLVRSDTLFCVLPTLADQILQGLKQGVEESRVRGTETYDRCIPDSRVWDRQHPLYFLEQVGRRVYFFVAAATGG